MKFISNVTFSAWPGKSVNPNFLQYQSDKNVKKIIKDSCKNLYLHPKSFKTTVKSNSYLMSISRRGPITPSTPTFPNIDVTKATENLLVVLKCH